MSQLSSVLWDDIGLLVIKDDSNVIGCTSACCKC